MLAGLGIALVPSAAATGGSVKKYDACLQIGGAPACFSPKVASGLPAGAKVELLLTIKNQLASSVKLGSANLAAPAALPIDTGTVAFASGAGTFGTNTSSQIQLRNLYLSKGQTVSVRFMVTAPCSGSGFGWTISAKEKNDYSGSGVFTLINQTGLTSNIVGSCKLAWDTEPASAAKDATITGEPYDTNGDVVAVKAVDANGNPMTTTGPTVTLAPSAGSFSGTDAQLSGGAATFANFKGAQTGTGFKVNASTPGFDASGLSGPFTISLAGTACSGTSCVIPPTELSGNSQVGVTGTGGASFLAIDASEVPASVTASGGGCENYQSLGNAAFEVTGSWSGNAGVTELKYTISNDLLPDSHFPLFIPLCAGGQRLNDAGNPVRCDQEPAGTKGWLGAALGSNHWFNGQYRYARCNTVDGLWWGILAPWFVVNSKVHPSVTSWYFSDGGASTTYVVKVPAPWDWRMG